MTSSWQKTSSLGSCFRKKSKACLLVDKGKKANKALCLTGMPIILTDSIDQLDQSLTLST